MELRDILNFTQLVNSYEYVAKLVISCAGGQIVMTQKDFQKHLVWMSITAAANATFVKDHLPEVQMVN